MSLPQAEEEIRLVLARISAFPQHRAVGVMLDDCVVTGRDEVAAERLRFLPQIPELQLLIAHHARIRRAAGLVFAREIIDHDALELVRLVHHVMWNA